jgi:hypothetical protein
MLTSDTNKDWVTSSSVYCVSDEISSTRLPDKIVLNIKGRSRVAVRSVGDLELYMSVIEPLFEKYSSYKG